MIVKLRTDFNEIDGEEVWTSLRRTNFLPLGAPVPGDIVELWDGDDNCCFARVEAVRDPIIFLKLYLNTWTERTEVTFPRPYEPPAAPRGEWSPTRVPGTAGDTTPLSLRVR